MTTPFRIALIGAGPKGTYALERLTIELDRRNVDRLEQVEVHIFEPHAYPGAGPVYDPAQPGYLRMNFANGKIDMWSDDARPSGSTFVEFLAGRGLDADPCGYAPRAMVGRYLHAGFNEIVARLRRSATVVVHPTRVVGVDSDGEASTLIVHDADGTSTRCDEVLLATGHESRRRSDHDAMHAYPIERPGGVVDIAAGSRVAVRGFGLTSIDVALALTEGRGGRFEPTDGAGRLHYVPSGMEPARILPYSRTGRPMTPKPHPTLGPQITGRDRLLHEGARRLDAAVRGSRTPVDAVRNELVRTATGLLEAVAPDGPARPDIDRHLARLLDRHPVQPDVVRREMISGVDVAHGTHPPGPDWALGEAWRLLYPTLVDLVETRALDAEWHEFQALAVEMERVAFGPPAENAARLVALVEAGVVDVSCSAAADVEGNGDGLVLTGAFAGAPVDVLVDAVLAPAGAAPQPSPVIAGLLASGLGRVTDHSAGLDVLADARCVGASGTPTRGLSALGRPTEGSVLGNDTLSRTLHAGPERWAARVADRVLSPEVSS